MYNIHIIHHFNLLKFFEKSVDFNFSEESTGTISFFGLVCPLIDILKKGTTLVIDDLNCNLHPKIVEFIVKLFNSNKSNPNHAQLIFSTHDVYILSQKLFRRDQIWFCEKNRLLKFIHCLNSVQTRIKIILLCVIYQEDMELCH